MKTEFSWFRPCINFVLVAVFGIYSIIRCCNLKCLEYRESSNPKRRGRPKKNTKWGGARESPSAQRNFVIYGTGDAELDHNVDPDRLRFTSPSCNTRSGSATSTPGSASHLTSRIPMLTLTTPSRDRGQALPHTSPPRSYSNRSTASSVSPSTRQNREYEVKSEVKEIVNNTLDECFELIQDRLELSNEDADDMLKKFLRFTQLSDRLVDDRLEVLRRNMKLAVECAKISGRVMSVSLALSNGFSNQGDLVLFDTYAHASEYLNLRGRGSLHRARLHAMKFGPGVAVSPPKFTRTREKPQWQMLVDAFMEKSENSRPSPSATAVNKQTGAVVPRRYRYDTYDRAYVKFIDWFEERIDVDGAGGEGKIVEGRNAPVSRSHFCAYLRNAGYKARKPKTGLCFKCDDLGFQIIHQLKDLSQRVVYPNNKERHGEIVHDLDSWLGHVMFGKFHSCAREHNEVRNHCSKLMFEDCEQPHSQICVQCETPKEIVLVLRHFLASEDRNKFDPDVRLCDLAVSKLRAFVAHQIRTKESMSFYESFMNDVEDDTSVIVCDFKMKQQKMVPSENGRDWYGKRALFSVLGVVIITVVSVEESENIEDSVGISTEDLSKWGTTLRVETKQQQQHSIVNTADGRVIVAQFHDIVCEDTSQNAEWVIGAFDSLMTMLKSSAKPPEMIAPKQKLCVFSDGGSHFHNAPFVLFLREWSVRYGVDVSRLSFFEPGSGKSWADWHFALISHATQKFVSLGKPIETLDDFDEAVAGLTATFVHRLQLNRGQAVVKSQHKALAAPSVYIEYCNDQEEDVIKFYHAYGDKEPSRTLRVSEMVTTVPVLGELSASGRVIGHATGSKIDTPMYARTNDGRAKKASFFHVAALPKRATSVPPSFVSGSAPLEIRNIDSDAEDDVYVAGWARHAMNKGLDKDKTMGTNRLDPVTKAFVLWHFWHGVMNSTDRRNADTVFADMNDKCRSGQLHGNPLSYPQVKSLLNTFSVNYKKGKIAQPGWWDANDFTPVNTIDTSSRARGRGRGRGRALGRACGHARGQKSRKLQSTAENDLSDESSVEGFDSSEEDEIDGHSLCAVEGGDGDDPEENDILRNLPTTRSTRYTRRSAPAGQRRSARLRH